jgi:hypothetical protein
MWESGATHQEGAESLLVLCKIHQPKTASRHANESTARSACKRKVVDEGIGSCETAAVRSPNSTSRVAGAASEAHSLPQDRNRGVKDAEDGAQPLR